MDEHLAELVRQWLKRYEERGARLSQNQVLHRHLLAKDAQEHARSPKLHDGSLDTGAGEGATSTATHPPSRSARPR